MMTIGAIILFLSGYAARALSERRRAIVATSRPELGRVAPRALAPWVRSRH